MENYSGDLLIPFQAIVAIHKPWGLQPPLVFGQGVDDGVSAQGLSISAADIQHPLFYRTLSTLCLDDLLCDLATGQACN